MAAWQVGRGAGLGERGQVDGRTAYSCTHTRIHLHAHKEARNRAEPARTALLLFGTTNLQVTE